MYNEEITESGNPCIFVACSASIARDVQSGDNTDKRPYGIWIDATQPLHHIEAQVQEMLSKSEERGARDFIIDTSANFLEVGPTIHATLEEAAKLAEFIKDFGEFGITVLVEFFQTDEIDQARLYIEGPYVGSFDTMQEFARDYIENSDYFGPEFNRRYESGEIGDDVINWHNLALELTSGQIVFEWNNQYHIFIE